MTNLRRTYFDLRRSVRLKRLRIKLLAVMLMVPFTQIVIATMDTLLQFGLIKCVSLDVCGGVWGWVQSGTGIFFHPRTMVACNMPISHPPPPLLSY